MKAKISGVRCLVKKENNTVTFTTVRGKPILGLVEIEAELLAHPCPKFAFKGQLIANVKGSSSDKQVATKKIMANQRLNKKGLVCHIIDAITTTKYSYAQRRQWLNYYIKGLQYTKVLPI
jgi:hypothetical protein